MEKKVHIVKNWTDRIHERVNGIQDIAKKNLRDFWRRLKSLFRRAPAETTKANKDSEKC